MEIEFCRRQHAKDTAKADEAGGGAKSYCRRQHEKLLREAAQKATAGGGAKSYGGESDAGGAIICQHCLSLLDSLIQQRLL